VQTGNARTFGEGIVVILSMVSAWNANARATPMGDPGACVTKKSPTPFNQSRNRAHQEAGFPGHSSGGICFCLPEPWPFLYLVFTSPIG
jgi:hypothetical protein